MASEADFYIKEGDTSPPLRAQLREDDGTPVDCTGALVRFRMTAVGGDTLITDARATITSPTDGHIRYDWQSDDTDETAYYNGVVVVDYDGATEVVDETQTYSANTDVYALDNTDVLTNGYYTVSIDDASGDTYDSGTDFAVIDDDGDDELDSIDWSIGGGSPDDGEDFFVTYHYATQFTGDETFPNDQYIVVKVDEGL